MLNIFILIWDYQTGDGVNNVANEFKVSDYWMYLRSRIIEEVLILPETEIVRSGIINNETIGFKERIKPKIIFANFSDPNIKLLLKLKQRYYKKFKS